MAVGGSAVQSIVLWVDTRGALREGSVMHRHKDICLEPDPAIEHLKKGHRVFLILNGDNLVWVRKTFCRPSSPSTN